MPTLLLEFHDALLHDTNLTEQLHSIGYSIYYMHKGKKHPIEKLAQTRSQMTSRASTMCVPDQNG